jgi:tetratricopeptide (TPR) repeat protein
VFLFLLFGFFCNAQVFNADSLKKILASNPDDTTRIKVLRQLGYHYWERNPDSSIYYSQLLITFGRKIKNEEAEAHGLTRMGRAFNNKGNFPKAMEYLLSALRKFEHIKDNYWIANSYNHIGNVNKGVEKYDLAIYYYKVCLNLAEKNNDHTNQMIASMNLGYVYNDINNLDSALFFAQRAYQHNRKVGVEDELDIIYFVLGSVYDKLREPEVAKAYFLRSISIAVRDHDMKPAAISYNALANLYKELAQQDSAFFYCKKALNAASESSSPENILEANNLLALLYEEKRQYDSAYFYQKASIAAKDSLVNNEKTRQVEALNYNEQARQQEIIAQERKLEEERKTYLQFAGIGIGLTSLLLVFLALSRKTITSTKTIEIVGVIVLLFVFEFINLLIHPFIGNLTHHSPLLMLLIMVCIAALLVPAHHRLEKWITHKLVEKNKRIRLEAAKRTISKLEGKVQE